MPPVFSRAADGWKAAPVLFFVAVISGRLMIRLRRATLSAAANSRGSSRTIHHTRRSPGPDVFVVITGCQNEGGKRCPGMAASRKTRTAPFRPFITHQPRHHLRTADDDCRRPEEEGKSIFSRHYFCFYWCGCQTGLSYKKRITSPKKCVPLNGVAVHVDKSKAVLPLLKVPQTERLRPAAV